MGLTHDSIDLVYHKLYALGRNSVYENRLENTNLFLCLCALGAVCNRTIGGLVFVTNTVKKSMRLGI